jgi:hypothetical protein
MCYDTNSLREDLFMSDPSIPPTNGHLNPFVAGFAHFKAYIANRVPIETLQELASAPAPQPAEPPKKPKPTPKPKRGTADGDKRYSPIDLTLYSIQTFGFTHPNHGNFLLAPKEFQAIMARETKAVATVIWEIMEQTIGWETGRVTGGRREWAPLTKRHFVRAGLLSRAQVERGLKQALEKSYIERRQCGASRYEYRIRWRGTN